MLRVARGSRINHKKGIKSGKKAQRREDAEFRNEQYRKLTTEQKIAKLDKGGFVARRQRVRLGQIIEVTE